MPLRKQGSVAYGRNAFMLLCSACDDVVFLGLGKRNYTPGGNQATARRRRKRRGGSKGFSVRGYMVAEGGGNGGEHRMPGGRLASLHC